MKSTVLEDIRAIDLAIAPIFIQSLISRDLFQLLFLCHFGSSDDNIIAPDIKHFGGIQD
jgi:hypothetical protein